MIFRPRPSQQQAMDWMQGRGSCALWKDMGLGKTVTVLTVVSELLASLEVSRCLVLAPPLVARETWPNELKKWDHLKWLKAQVLPSGGGQFNRWKNLKARKNKEKELSTAKEKLRKIKKQLDSAIQSHADIDLMGLNDIPWLVSCFRAGRGWPWDVVVFDESSKVKGRGEWFKSLRRISPKIKLMYQLTGTPGKHLDLWPQVFLLDQGQRLGKTFTGYRTQYFESDYHGFKWTPRTGAEEAIEEKISDIVLPMEAEDYLQLPPCMELDHEIHLPEKVTDQYKELEKELFIELEQDQVVAPNRGVLQGKLLQLTGGAVYLSEDYRQEENASWKKIHDQKLELLKELREQHEGPILICYQYLHEVERIQKVLPKAVWIKDVEEVENTWNAGKINELIAHPGSMYGLNLQQGGNRVIWFTMPWSNDDYVQTIARFRRPNQPKDTVFSHRLIASNTIDLDVAKALRDGRDTRKSLIKGIQKRQQGEL